MTDDLELSKKCSFGDEVKNALADFTPEMRERIMEALMAAEQRANLTDTHAEIHDYGRGVLFRSVRLDRSVTPFEKVPFAAYMHVAYARRLMNALAEVLHHADTKALEL